MLGEILGRDSMTHFSGFYKKGFWMRWEGVWMVFGQGITLTRLSWGDPEIRAKSSDGWGDGVC